MMTRCFIGLGSNLDCPQQQVVSALTQLAHLAETRLLLCSSLYQSAPLGPQDQPDFINAVVAIETGLAAHDLLVAMQGIEQAHGRERQIHWGPRTLDLDLLLYGNQTINSSTLTVPHPHMLARNFVIHPLFEIAADLVLPDGVYLREIYKQCSAEGLVRITNSRPEPLVEYTV